MVGRPVPAAHAVACDTGRILHELMRKYPSGRHQLVSPGPSVASAYPAGAVRGERNANAVRPLPCFEVALT